MTVATPPAHADTGASGTPPATPAAAPAAPASSPAPATPTPAPTPAPAKPATPETPPNGFKVPDAYKDKPWASKVTSEEDLWKQLENAQTVIGKKTATLDFEKATPQEIEQYLAQTRPPSADVYKFAEGTEPGVQKVLGESLLKYGITPYQANGVIAAYQEAEKAATAPLFSPEGMEAEMKKSFGEADWKTAGANTAKLIKSNLNAEDAAVVEQLPNPFLGLFYRMANNLVKAYGITESGAHTEAGNGAPAATDINKVREGIRSEIRALTRKPHTAAEKQALQDKLSATYK